MKKSIQIQIGMSIVALSGFLVAENAQAAILTGVNGSIINYTFTETDHSADLVINGGRINSDDNFSLGGIVSQYWTVSGNIDLDSDIDDEISLTINLAHLQDHHDVAGVTYTSNLNLLAENATGTTLTVNGPGAIYHHADGHDDIFFNEKISANIDTTFPDIDNIATWNYTLSATHDVPEPITGLVLAAGLGGAALKRAKDQSTTFPPQDCIY